MTCATAATTWARPNIPADPNILKKAVPETFGGWKTLDQGAQIVDPATQGTIDKIYQETLSRTYVNEAGYRVMLSLAHSGNQIGAQEAHPPEICYASQGFKVLGEVEAGSLPTAFGSIQVRRMNTSMGARVEPVTYWMTMAGRVVHTQLEKRKVQIISVLNKESPGGFLFRVSSIDPDADHAFAEQEKFVADLMTAVAPDARHKLGGFPSHQ
jgi:EpsI family protein